MYNDLMSMFDDFSNLFKASSICADVEKTEDSYVITMDIPGVKKEDVSIDFQDQTLTVTVNDAPESKKEYLTKERFGVSGSRSFELKDADGDSIKAKIDLGVLEITVGLKKQPSKSIVIE